MRSGAIRTEKPSFRRPGPIVALTASINTECPRPPPDTLWAQPPWPGRTRSTSARAGLEEPHGAVLADRQGSRSRPPRAARINRTLRGRSVPEQSYPVSSGCGDSYLASPPIHTYPGNAPWSIMLVFVARYKRMHQDRQHHQYDADPPVEARDHTATLLCASADDRNWPPGRRPE